MEVTTAAFFLTAEHRVFRGHSQIVLYGTSPHGTVHVTSLFKPYFFVESAKEKKPLSALPPCEPSPQPFTALDGTEVNKLTFLNQIDADRAADILRAQGRRVFESDIRPRDRFLQDRFVNGSSLIAGVAVQRGSILSFSDPQFQPVEWKPEFRICSLDIETSISSGALLSIGAQIVGRGEEIERVFMQGMASSSHATVSFHPTESALLTDFLAWFHLADPDLIIGWNVIGFDLSFLLKRAQLAGINFNLGRDDRAYTVHESSGRFSRATVPGRVVLDGPQTLRNSFYSFESFSLENVSQQVLGEGKLISPQTGNRAYEIERQFRDAPLDLAAYNLKDCVLVTRIFKMLQLVELTTQRSFHSGMLLDQVGMSVASLDHFYLPRLHAEGVVAPDLAEIIVESASSGGWVMTPAAGLTDNVIGLDFHSLYPSIIRTFLIDPLSRACKSTDPLTTPSGHGFSRTRHLLPTFVESLMQARAGARERNDPILSQSIKILMNSFYGVMGSAGSRLYHPDLPDAITQTGQWLLRESQAYLESQGMRVLYGDTDSLFVRPGQSAENYSKLGQQVATELTEYWTERIQREFGLSSCLRVEFKKHYRKFLIPSARGAAVGAKKRYAGLVADSVEDTLEFVGLEVVRSDWTVLARDFQRELYGKIFRDEPYAHWIRQVVQDLRAGKLDEKLVYKKRLHKPASEYGPSAPPYARAALLLARPVREVRYIMTRRGPIPQELAPYDPDYTHYIDKQLRPVADSILEVLGSSFAAQINPVQLSLF